MAERKPIRVLANAQELIDAVAAHGPLTPAEIAERTGIPRPSVYRLADGLTAIGLTQALPDSRVGLSLRWLHLSDKAVAGMGEWAGARRSLFAITEETDQTAFLTLPRGEEAVCIGWSPGRGIGVLILKPGRSLPLYAGAAGRVMLAHLPTVETYLQRAPFEPLTAQTLVTREALLQDVERTRAEGYAHSDEDATIGIGALGVPLLNRSGAIAGCLSLAGVAEDIRERREEFVAVLTRHAAAWADSREEQTTS